MIVEYHPLTVSDCKNAISYYNRQRPNLGNEFRSEVYAAIERIRSNPLQFPIMDHNIRRGFMHRFPYSVLFHVVNEDTVRRLFGRLFVSGFYI